MQVEFAFLKSKGPTLLIIAVAPPQNENICEINVLVSGRMQGGFFSAIVA